MKLRHLPYRLNLVELAERGFWYCRGCRRVTELDLDGPVNCCVLCGCSAVQWREPVFREPSYENKPCESVVDLAAAVRAGRMGESPGTSYRALAGG
jgi:hypothetical protein